MPGSELPTFPTSIGTSDLTSINLLGQDLAHDLMGQVSFGELAFWLVAQRRPTPGQLRVFEAVLVALADHGFTPTAIAARLTYLSAPDSLQGAVAAGLLGGGSRFLGVTEDCARFLADALAGRPEQPADDAGWDELATQVVSQARAARRIIPGLGHPVHKSGDPRTPALIALADQEGVRGPHLRLFQAIGRVHPEILGRSLPLERRRGLRRCPRRPRPARGDAARLRAPCPHRRRAGAHRRRATATRRHGHLPHHRPQRQVPASRTRNQPRHANGTTRTSHDEGTS